MKKKLALAFSTIFFVLLSACDSSSSTTFSIPLPEISHRNNDILLKNQTNDLHRQEMYDDILYLTDTLEKNHPAFYLDDVPPIYWKYKNEFLHTLDVSDIDPIEFEYGIRKILSSLDDEHTELIDKNNNSIKMLNMKCIYKSGKFIYTENGQEIGNIVSINNIPIGQIETTIDNIKPIENEIGRAISYIELSRQYKTYTFLGCSLPDKVDVEISSNSGIIKKTVDYFYKSLMSSENTIKWEVRDNYFYLKFSVCKMGDELDQSITALKDYLSRGGKNFVIDVIDNPGGDSTAGNLILEALNMTPPRSGSIDPPSPYLLENKKPFIGQKSKEAIFSGNIYKTEPDLSEARQNHNIDLYVLMNEHTASSAMLFALWVQDGRLGTLLGRPSLNSPTSYGDIITIDLPNNKLSFNLSLRYFLRPDKDADQFMLTPDIIVSTDADMFEVLHSTLNT